MRYNNDFSEKLKLDSLTVGYNGVPLISDITLSLGKGEIITLIGPNGSGKSTILKSITRHLATIAGTVYIDEKNMRTLSGKEIATKLAVVLTERVRPEMMSCRELVAAGRYPYTNSFGLLTARDREVVEYSLSRVHALDIADKDVTAISDGQRQRVLLARAICQEPEIIVLDEPTSFLDVKHKIELLEILSDMAKNQGISVVMSLHEIDLAERISDKIVCVKGDRIAAYGTPDEIFSNDTIASLYGIESGSFNALLGSVELSAPKGEARCFVVGGNSRGIPYYRALRKRGVPFYAGILAENDIDVSVAVPLATRAVISAAYEPITDELVREAKALIDSVEFVVY
ncbi:MAG: ABC transporter ATP-binding protein, partial [Clostridia bacterium]|nr:ABC transporter ATP-binding protein [Clostridia bacterium]